MAGKTYACQFCKNRIETLICPYCGEGKHGINGQIICDTKRHDMRPCIGVLTDRYLILRTITPGEAARGSVAGQFGMIGGLVGAAINTSIEMAKKYDFGYYDLKELTKVVYPYYNNKLKKPYALRFVNADGSDFLLVMGKKEAAALAGALSAVGVYVENGEGQNGGDVFCAKPFLAAKDTSKRICYSASRFVQRTEKQFVAPPLVNAAQYAAPQPQEPQPAAQIPQQTEQQPQQTYAQQTQQTYAQPQQTYAQQPQQIYAQQPQTYAQQPQQTYAQQTRQTYAQQPQTYAQQTQQTYAQQTQQTYAQQTQTYAQPQQTYAQQPQQTYAQQTQQTYAQQPRQTYAQQTRQTYAQQPQQTYAQQPRQTYAQQPQQTYAQQTRQTYAQQQQTYAQQPQQTYAQPGQPYAQTNAYSVKTEAEKTAALLKQYKELVDAGVITQEDFDAKKKQLLG